MSQHEKESARLEAAVRRIGGPLVHEVLRGLVRAGRIPRLRQPVTFNEKLIRRKLFDRDARFPGLADKAQARELAIARLGSEAVTQLYWCGRQMDESAFAALPTSFAVRATHGSGPAFMSLVKDKRELGLDGLRALTEHYLGKRYGYATNEWWYSQIEPQVMIEEMLDDRQYGVPLDYKFYVFHGQARFVQVDHGRFTDHTRRFYDREWCPQEFTMNYPMGPIIAKPRLFHMLRNAAERLAQGLDFVRVDLYAVNEERLLFGELTLSPGAGWARFTPAAWDSTLGSLW